MSSTSPSRLKNKERVHVKCTVCGTDIEISYETFHRKGEQSYPWKCKRCVMSTMSKEDKEKRSEKIKSALGSKTAEEKASMTAKRLETISDPSIKEENKRKKQETWANKSTDELKKISERASANTQRIWDTMSDEEKEYRQEKRMEGFRNWYDNLSEGEKLELAQRKSEIIQEYWDNQTEEFKLQHGAKSKEWWNSLSDEEKKELTRQRVEGINSYWENLSDEERELRVNSIREIHKQYWDSLTDEERQQRAKSFGENIHNWYESLSEEEKLKRSRSLSEFGKEWWNSLSDEEKQEHSRKTKEAMDNLTDEQKRIMRENISASLVKFWNNAPDDLKECRASQLSEGRYKWYASLSDEEKQKIAEAASVAQKLYWSNLPNDEKLRMSNQQKERWNNLPDEKKIEHIRKTFSNSSPTDNGLNKRFERQFSESFISNDFYFIPEVILSNDHIIHSWDYGIYDKSNDQLVMVVDLDGAYFHADNCDYDGMHSKEEYDEKRAQSIPSDASIKYCIIYESKLSQSFDQMIKILMLNYNEFIEYIFTEMRNISLPYPTYTDIDLLKSYNQLLNLNTTDKYHSDISINVRSGDRLIQHFHRSIWHAHIKGNISPYEAWYDDKLLMKCIQNRIIYQSRLNPNKILQGFNISKIAPKVSIFSASRAKLIINKYLSEFNVVFDPFSGYSGRMLGTVSLNKTYIGQDINEHTVQESNQLIKFLKDNFSNINATITQQDILQSYGEYQCLFTCPPYSDKEQWNGTPVDRRTCDEWIDICLSHFKCKKYVFVVDKTTKYQKYVTEEIINKSHFSNAKEYVIVITRAI